LFEYFGLLFLVFWLGWRGVRDLLVGSVVVFDYHGDDIFYLGYWIVFLVFGVWMLGWGFC
jgi:hypothetical protein